MCRNSSSFLIHIGPQRMCLLVAVAFALSGCSKNSESPSNSGPVEDAPVVNAADAGQDIPKAATPQWPALPESDYAAKQQEFLAALQTQFRNVKLIPTAVGQLTPNMKSDKYRVKYYGDVLTDLSEFEDAINVACGVSINELREQYKQMMTDEETVQGQRIQLVNSRLDWYSKNNPDAPEAVEFRELLRTSQAALQSVQKLKPLLQGENCKSVVMAQDFLRTIDPVKSEFPALHNSVTACLAPFQSAIESTNKLKPELVTWVSTPINIQLKELVRKQAVLQPRLTLEELRVETLRHVQDDNRADFSGSDEEWKAFRFLLSALKKEKPGKMPKTAFETCLASKLFESLPTEISAGANIYGSASDVLVVGVNAGDPKTNEGFQAVTKQIINEERVKPLRAIAASLDREIAVLNERNAEIQRLSTVVSPSTDNAAIGFPVNNDPAIPNAAPAVEPVVADAPMNAPLNADHPEKKADLTENSIGMKFSLIPVGTFTMGSPASEKGRKEIEIPHTVTISKNFQLGVFEVTQDQYEAVMRTNPSKFKGASNPVEQVSWDEATEFCRKLSALPKEKAAKNRYRLPTEAEWEYACRAGTTTASYFGNDSKALKEHVWYLDNSSKQTHPVGQKAPNAFGLYDMYGNVYEWCNDWYGDYSTNNAIDPAGPNLGGKVVDKVLRGNGWGNPTPEMRSATRGWAPSTYKSPEFGFRIVLEVP